MESEAALVFPTISRVDGSWIWCFKSIMTKLLSVKRGHLTRKPTVRNRKQLKINIIAILLV